MPIEISEPKRGIMQSVGKWFWLPLTPFHLTIIIIMRCLYLGIQMSKPGIFKMIVWNFSGENRIPQRLL